MEKENMLYKSAQNKKTQAKINILGLLIVLIACGLDLSATLAGSVCPFCEMQRNCLFLMGASAAIIGRFNIALLSIWLIIAFKGFEIAYSHIEYMYNAHLNAFGKVIEAWPKYTLAKKKLASLYIEQHIRPINWIYKSLSFYGLWLFTGIFTSCLFLLCKNIKQWYNQGSKLIQLCNSTLKRVVIPTLFLHACFAGCCDGLDEATLSKLKIDLEQGKKEYEAQLDEFAKQIKTNEFDNEIKTFKASFKENSHPKTLPSRVQAAKLLVFISAGMPKTLLQDYIKQCPNCIFYVFGFSKNLEFDENLVKWMNYKTPITIDHNPFYKYGVNTTPTLVLTNGKTYDKASGNISIDSFLNMVIDQGELKDEAQVMLRGDA